MELLRQQALPIKLGMAMGQVQLFSHPVQALLGVHWLMVSLTQVAFISGFGCPNLFHPIYDQFKYLLIYLKISNILVKEHKYRIS